MTDSSSSSQQGCDDPDCDRVVINIQDILQNTYFQPSRDCSINKVPVHLRNINEAAYTPQIISIGPFHRADKKLQPMQAYKKLFLNALLLRYPRIKLEDLVNFFRGLETQVRYRCFDQVFVCDINSDDFVEMMLLDGCFIVELLIGYNFDTENIELLPQPKNVRSDLMLYENQLPYFLLESLFNFLSEDPIPVTFFDLSASYFSFFLEEEGVCRLEDSSYQVKHFLDLILSCHQPMPSGLMPSVEDYTNEIATDRRTRKPPVYLPSATELHESSGVKFKKNESDCYLDIKFSENGVLEIPVLNVVDETERVFANMIAMEHCQVGNKNNACITHYIILMDCLISTPKDVALLRRSRIINNYLGSDEAVAQMFNKLGTGVMVDIEDSRYYEHIKNIEAFYNSRRNKWKANLNVNYFQNPWTIISLIAAIVLLICTIAQTVCSFISMKK